MQDYFKGFTIDLTLVKQHYLDRESVSKKLIKHLGNSDLQKYSELAVGVSDTIGNFSAAEHALGPKILEMNSYDSISKLAINLSEINIKAMHVADFIYQANLPYLKIGVGSEMACLLQPSRLWVGNVRTIWCHLVVKHEGDWGIANEELRLYKVDDTTSEMHYRIWKDIYIRMKFNLDKIYDLSVVWAKEQNIEPGKEKYLWVDAICSHLYDCE
ncbi:MAG: hypothetical protein OFPII_05130 [Osedax symbiont Rs1]|nr:MAG: hypothetical protein OFPII_05130 [Osedax symbiont Rs1]